jgi:hypothetical protein
LKSGYNDAVNLARKKLESFSPEKVCKLCGVKFNGDKYIVKWLAKEYELSLTASPDYSQALEIIFLHYLTSEGTKQPEGKLISYREVPTALFYEPKFIQRAVNPIVRTFGENPEKLIEIGERLGGVKSDAGEFAIKINLLPYLPVTYMIWAGDDEFESSGNILFDKTAPGWLCAEDLVVASSLGVYDLVGEYKKIYK